MNARGGPARVSRCHCRACKRRTGGAFSLNATWPEDALVVSGACQVHERVGEENGHWVRDYSCPTCGPRVYYCSELRPGPVSVPVGLFADAGVPPPRFKVHAESAMRGLQVRITPPPEQL